MADVPVEVGLQLPDGRSFVVHTTVDAQYADSQEFWWSEGNGACDCNRSLYLNREHDLNLGTADEPDDVPELPCGDTITLQFVKVNGSQQWPTGAPSGKD